MVVPGDADGRGVFEFGSVVLLGQYAVEARFEESAGNAHANVKRGGFSFVLSVSCWGDSQDVAGGAGCEGIAEGLGRIARRQAAGRGNCGTVCAVYKGEV